MEDSRNKSRRDQSFRDEMREIRVPQTRMTFLTYDRYQKQWGGGAPDNTDIFPESRMMRNAGGNVGKGPRSYRRSDQTIHEEVCRRLTHDPFIDASEIEVTVSEGEVILVGGIDSRANKRRLEDLVESVRGVTHFENRVRVITRNELRSQSRETFR